MLEQLKTTPADNLLKVCTGTSTILSREEAFRELFPRPIGGEHISIDGPCVELDRFLVRLRNLAGSGENVILLPMTGMERAYHFLSGFYSEVNPRCEVEPVDTNRFIGKPDLSRIAPNRQYLRVIVFDEECCNTYEGIMFALFEKGYDLSRIRRLRLNDPLTLHVGGDMCVSAVKRRDPSKSLSLSDVIEKWRQGREIGEYSSPNYGLRQAIGLAQFASTDLPAPLSFLRPFFTGHEELALHARRAVKASNLSFEAPRGVLECPLGQSGISGMLMNAFIAFQTSLAGLCEKDYRYIHERVLNFETLRKHDLRAIGIELAKRSESLSGPERFNLASLPYHWERPPEPFREAGI